MNEGQLMVFPAAATCMGVDKYVRRWLGGQLASYRQRNDCACESLNPDYARTSWVILQMQVANDRYSRAEAKAEGPAAVTGSSYTRQVSPHA